ncbi:hypothetical protein QTP70_020244 [Hemibagrus guttatus]|uniref:Uncharacterized protein n=1 Tax=Hemibagrus guttatus TaxID=175788 RepID=A0AAE0UKS5_9TELE|nr:hypothetical protein QTP70_020244 [Hemibagrus guttatus]KAK3527371.1 hypothetical protein QTP86_021914 [Hemibagrus guttatus]
MKACLTVLLVYAIFCEIFAGTRVDITPLLSTDVTVPVTTNTVNLQQPFCYFENTSLCANKTKCFVWLVSSLTSATSSYDKLTNGYIAPYSAIKSPDGLGSAYAGRSGAMVVITAILSAAMALLLLLLLIALILACCCRRRGKTQSYEARRQPSVIGSLRIPSYDVHNLKNPSPYDNPAYEQDLNKKRYTTNSTLPQKTTTVITHVQSSSPDNITLQKM